MIRTSKYVFGWGAIVLLLAAPLSAQNQPTCRVAPCVQNNHNVRMRVTYSGRIYFSFPKYGVYVSGAPQSAIDAQVPIGSRSSNVIVNNGRGLRWDGTSFFDHPAYHQELVTRHHYSNRTIRTPNVTPPNYVGIVHRNVPQFVVPKVTLPQRTAVSNVYFPTAAQRTAPVLTAPTSPVPTKPELPYSPGDPRTWRYEPPTPPRSMKHIQAYPVSTSIGPVLRSRCYEQTGATTAIQPIGARHCQ